MGGTSTLPITSSSAYRDSLSKEARLVQFFSVESFLRISRIRVVDVQRICLVPLCWKREKKIEYFRHWIRD